MASDNQVSEIPPDDDQTNDRYKRLCGLLKPERLDDFDIRELDEWLCSEVSARLIDVALLVTPEVENHGQKIQTCEKVEIAAEYLTERLLPLGLPPSLEQELFENFAADRPADRASEEWESLKARLATDLRTIMSAAQKANIALLIQGGSRGKPTNTWRNTTFSALTARLKLVLPTVSNEKLVGLSRQCWNIYFTRDRIMEDESAYQILRRQTKR